MRVLFISEVQWLSQPSRKHHIIRGLPEDCDVLFVSPINAGAGENSFLVRRDAQRPGVRYVSLPLPKPDSRFRAVRALSGLLSAAGRILLPAIARRFRADITVCSFIWAAPAVDSIRALGIPVVYDCNDLHPHDYPQCRARAEAAFRRLVESADEVVTPLSYLRDVCGRGRIIGNGTDLSVFTRRPQAAKPEALAQSNLGSKSELVVFVGSVDVKIDFEIVRHLLEELSRARRDAGLLVLGRVFSNVREKVDELVGRFGDRVFFRGRVPYASLADYLAYCRVGIMPYLMNARLRAANPSKLYMYAAMDLNTVSTPFSENVLEHEDLVYVATSPDDFAGAVMSALDDDERRLMVRERIATKNSWAKRANEFRELLTELVARGEVRRGNPPGDGPA